MLFVGPSRGVENVSVTILSHTSVEISWWPPPEEYWNGILTSYTVTSHSYRPSSMAAVNDSQLESELSNLTLHDISSHVYPLPDSVWASDAEHVVIEQIIIDGLHEFFTYKFTITATNSAGDSDPVTTSIVQLPGTSKTVSIDFELAWRYIASTKLSRAFRTTSRS